MSLERFKPYPAYKDSGVEWLGKIPAHWEVKRLWHLTPSDRRIMYGIVLPGPNVDDGVPIVKGGDVSPERLRLEGLNRTTQDIESRHLRSRLRGGDLVYAIRGSIGEVAMVPGELEGANLTQDAARIAYTSTTHGPWLMHALKSSAVFAQLEAGALGATIRGINIRDLKRASIAVPPREEQRAIAAFLDRETTRIDALVAKKERLIELLQEQRTALITRAVTKGLPSTSSGQTIPAVPMKDSGVEWLGEVARHWEVKRIKLIAHVGNGSTPNRENADYWGGDYPWLNSSVVNLAEVTEGSDFVTQLALRECHLPRIHPPAVLVGITGEGRTRGMATVLRIEATINQHLAFIRPTCARSDTQYVRYGLHAAYQFLRDVSGGGGSTKGALTCDQLGNLSIPYPPLAEQRAIAAFLDRETMRIDALIAKVRDAIERLRELRIALISVAVTGKIDVSEG